MPWPHKPAPARLDFEFQPRPPRAWASWLLLAVALAFTADVAGDYFTVRNALRDTAAELREAAHVSAAGDTDARRAYQPSDVQHEMAFARSAIYRIAFPWEEMFKALGNGREDNVALLDVHPDTETRTVQITAEARDLPAMLTYIARLEHDHYFQRVELLHHEIERDRPRQPVGFTLAATWDTQK